MLVMEIDKVKFGNLALTSRVGCAGEASHEELVTEVRTAQPPNLHVIEIGKADSSTYINNRSI
jgi:hypothetical protein